jgi:hypothetical protein
LKNLDPLPHDCLSGDFHQDALTWLEGTHYPEWRRAELREVASSFDYQSLVKKDLKNASFIKTESYPCYKHVRWINSRSDRFKVFSGPFFKLVEKLVFHGGLKKYFVKGVPVPERPKFIKDRLMRAGHQYMATYFSAFEGSFGPEIVKACELQLYSYLAQNLPHKVELMRWLSLALTGEQSCSMRECTAHGRARMSGDMCTSLGNGITNLLLILFACSEQGWDPDKVDGVFEGDDGLVRVDGPVPSSEFYARLGFSIKFDIFDDVGEAGFCQNYFVSSEDVPLNIVDPLKYLGKLGWTTSVAKHGGPGVMRSLLRAKCFSLLYSCPGTPVLEAMGRWLLRCTHGSAARWSENYWESVEMLGFTGVGARSEPTVAAREFVRRKFGIIPDVQIELEQYFDSLTDLQPISHPLVYNLVSERNPDWAANWHLSRLELTTGSVW